MDNSSQPTFQIVEPVHFPTTTSYPKLLELFSQRPQHSYAFAAISVILLLFVTYITTWLSYVQVQRNKKPQVPKIFPYSFPWIGNAFSFGLSPAKCIGSIARAVGPNGVFGIKLVGNTLYVLTGRNNVGQIRRYQGHITDPGVHEFCLIRVFGVAKKAVKMYSQDDSGIHPKPVSTSSIAPHNRVDHNTHKTFMQIFSGDGLNTLFRRWHESFSRRLGNLQIADEWIESSDFEKFWMPSLVGSLNEAMVGPILESVNPTFTDDFIEFYPYAHSLMKGIAQLFMPRATALRESLMRDFRTWHSVARAGFRDTDVEEDNTDRWWGLSAIRERQRLFTQVDGWDNDTLASLDFGLLWGANLNSHPASVWMVIEIFKDPELLARVRNELESMTTTPDERTTWMEELGNLPLMQSIYAEVLRLRTGVQTVFRDNRADIHINEWRIPKKSLIIVPTVEAHTDETYWNTRNGKHPLNRFWADRFLAYPGDAQSGPSREANPAREKNAAKSRTGPRFVNVGSSDAWIPYGVGERACPGRFFARRQMLAFCAIVVKNYDIEFLSLNPKAHVPSGDTFFGLGVLRPKNALPFRLRRVSYTVEGV